jgi:hypothetical protein
MVIADLMNADCGFGLLIADWGLRLCSINPLNNQQAAVDNQQ